MGTAHTGGPSLAHHHSSILTLWRDCGYWRPFDTLSAGLPRSTDPAGCLGGTQARCKSRSRADSLVFSDNHPLLLSDNLQPREYSSCVNSLHLVIIKLCWHYTLVMLILQKMIRHGKSSTTFPLFSSIKGMTKSQGAPFPPNPKERNITYVYFLLDKVMTGGDCKIYSRLCYEGGTYSTIFWCFLQQKDSVPYRWYTNISKRVSSSVWLRKASVPVKLWSEQETVFFVEYIYCFLKDSLAVKV